MQGGIAKHLHLLRLALAEHVDIDLYSYSGKNDVESTWKKLVERSQDLFRLFAALKRSRPDLIQHNSAFDARSILRDTPLVWIAKIVGVPLLLKVHGSHRETFGHLAPPLSWLRSSLLKNVRMLGVLSRQEKAEFLSLCPRLQKRVRVVKNVIGQEFLNIVRQESDYPTVLFISRFVKMKGPFDLLEAVPAVLHECAAARFVFAGSGPAVEEFLFEVKRRALEKCVTWVGNLDHTATIEYYERSWVFAFPTHFPEGMPMVIAEAMAAGIPIVTTRTRFSTSYMEEGKHCLFVDHSDPASLGRAICALLNNPGMRSEFSANNRQFAKQFSLDRVVEEYLAIYSEIVASQH